MGFGLEDVRRVLYEFDSSDWARTHPSSDGFELQLTARYADDGFAAPPL